MDHTRIRSYIVKGLMGCLVVAAAIAIISILIGSMTEVAWRALSTVFVTAFHGLVILGVLSFQSSTGNEKTEVEHKQSAATALVVNTVLVLIAANFLTSTMGVWDIISDSVVGKFLLSYFMVLLAVLFARPMYGAEVINKKLHPYAVANYTILGLLTVLIIGSIFNSDLFTYGNGFYGRSMLALLIAFITNTFIMAILQHLYMQAHREQSVASTTPAPQKAGTHPLLIVGLIILALYLLPSIFGIFYAIFGGYSRF